MPFQFIILPDKLVLIDTIFHYKFGSHMYDTVNGVYGSRSTSLTVDVLI